MTEPNDRERDPTIRGFRIDLREVEGVLSEHANVRAVCVILSEDRPETRRLVAYIEGDVDPADLRDYLSSRVPEYMVPSAFVRLERLPLTPDGKVDVAALPTLEPAPMQFEESLFILADLDSISPSLVVELMGALDEMHRAHGGGGLRVLTSHASSDVFAAVNS